MSSTTSSPSSTADREETVRLCVRCRKAPQVSGFRPFCSSRCRLLDLGGWLTESYRVEGEAVPADGPSSEKQDSRPESR